MSLIRSQQLAQRPTINTYWFDISGDDTTGDGTTAFPFLTIQKTIDTIKTNHPTRSENSQFTAAALTSYSLAESVDLANADWINLYAPGNDFRCNLFRIGDNQVITIKMIKRLSGVGDLIQKVGVGTSILNVEIAKSTIATSGGLEFFGSGGAPTLYINCKEFTVAATTDTLVTSTGSGNARLYLNAILVRGKIFTTQITDKYFVNSVDHIGDFSLNANSELHFSYKNWNGKIAGSAALTKIYFHEGKRTVNPSNDVLHADAFVYKDGKRFRVHRTATNYNPSVLTDHRVIVITDTSSPRSVVISTENIQEASLESPEYFTVKDESGGAGTNNITISGETGNIEKVANFVLKADGESVTFYSDSTDLWIV